MQLADQALDNLMAMPVEAVPADEQLRWRQLVVHGFIHAQPVAAQTRTASTPTSSDGLRRKWQPRPARDPLTLTVQAMLTCVML